MKTGWEVKALGEVCTKIGSGATPRGGYESYKEAGIPLIRSLNVHDLEFRLKELARIDDEQAEALSNVEVIAGDVLLNITGASVARCCIAPVDMLPARVNQHVSILRPKPQTLSTEFLAYLLVSKEMKDKLLGIGDEGGATRQALTKAQLQAFPIPLPPLTEQKRIVTVLDAAFEGLTRARAHTETNLQNARELFGTTIRSLLDHEAEDPATILTSLGEVCEIHSGAGFPDRYQGLASGDFPFFKVGDMNKAGNEIALQTANNYVSDEVRKVLGAKVFKPDSIVFPKVGGAIATNKKRKIIVPSCVDNNVMGLWPIPEKIDAAYLSWWLQGFDIYEFSNKAALPSITKATVSDWPLVLPQKIRQQEIAAELQVIWQQSEELQSHYRAKLADLDDLRQSILQKAFVGELT